MIIPAIFNQIILKRIINKSTDKGFEVTKRILSDDFGKRLNQVISKTIKSYDEKNPILDDSGQYAFYKSEILVEKLSDYILFDEPLDEKAICTELKKNSKIIQPTQIQLDTFFGLFFELVQADEKLKDLYIEENFKERIFEIEPHLQNIDRKLENIETNVERLIESVLNINSKKWLNRFLNDIKIFQPRTALRHLDFFQREINVDDKYDENIQAEVHYLKGIAYSELQEIEQCYQEYINAYKIIPSNLRYKKKIILLYLEDGKNTEAKGLIEEILLEKKFDPVAWAAKCFLSENLSSELEEVPDIVLTGNSKKSFMITICNLIKDKSIHLLIDECFKNEVKDIDYPKEVNFENQGYWLTVSNLLFSSIDRESSYTPDKINPKIRQNPNLQKSIELHEFILPYFQGTEKTKLLLILTFRLTFCKYLLSGKESEVDHLVSLFNKLDESRKQSSLPLISIALLHTNRYEKIIEITKNKETEIPLITLPIRIFAHFRLEQYNEAKRIANLYLKKIPKIDSMNLSTFLMLFDFYEDQVSRENAYTDFIKEAKCQHTGQELLLKFACYLPFHSKESLVEILEKALEENPEDDLYIRGLIAQSFLIIHQSKRAVDLFKSFVDVNQYSLELENYIKSLMEANSDNGTLLELLKKWRKQNYSIEQDFLLKELELLNEIRDWEQIEEVARIGVEYFSENDYFLFSLVLSFHKQKKVAAFNKTVSSIIEKRKLPLDITFKLAKIATYQGDIELALELCYTHASNRDNKTGRNFYFHQFSTHLDMKSSKVIEKVQADCYVLVKAKETIELRKVSDVSKEHDPVVKWIYGKKVGDIVSITKPFMHGIEQVEIVAILDKYRGLLREITEENSHERINSTHFKIQGDDLETLNKQLVSLLGAEGSVLKEVEEKLYNDYSLGSKSFSELVKNKDYNPISVYYNLTSSVKKGITVCPLLAFKDLTLKSDAEFVLDSTSLLLFFQLSENIGIEFQQKFWISKILLELIEQELYKAQSGKEITLTLQITMKGVIPYFLPEGNRVSNIQFLKKLLNWIDCKCQTRLVKEKLDIVTELREKGRSINEYTDSVIDTMLLASSSNNVLISDDLIYSKNLFIKGQQISTEFFLRNKFINYNADIIPFLVKMNYREIQIPKKFIFSELDKHLNREKNFFYSCLENISLINRNNNMVNEVVEMVRKVYFNDNIFLSRKSILAQQIFAQALKGVTRTTRTKNLIK